MRLGNQRGPLVAVRSGLSLRRRGSAMSDVKNPILIVLVEQIEATQVEWKMEMVVCHKPDLILPPPLKTQIYMVRMDE
jgi:hypothetical protein